MPVYLVGLPLQASGAYIIHVLYFVIEFLLTILPFINIFLNPEVDIAASSVETILMSDLTI